MNGVGAFAMIAVVACAIYAAWAIAGWADKRNEAVRQGRAQRVFDAEKIDEYGARIARKKLRRTGQRLRQWWLKDHEPPI